MASASSCGLPTQPAAHAAARGTARREDEAAAWIELVTGAEVVGNFSATLRSGQILCELVNRIKPGVVASINSAGKPFKERENISNFLKACRALGVREHSLFSTDDLYDERGLPSVANCIHALGAAVQQTAPSFGGPHLGVPATPRAGDRETRARPSPEKESGPAESLGAAKQGAGLEDGARKWIEGVTGARLVGDLSEALRTGQVLCELVNKIKPATVPKVNAAGMPFKERENISSFIKACRTLGVQEHALFSTDDLYDGKNMPSVVSCLHALGGAVQRTVPEFRGPHIGILDASHAKRHERRSLGPVQQTNGLSSALERAKIGTPREVAVPANVVRSSQLGG